MSNYYCNIAPVSRRKGLSLADRANYITGEPLRDCYNGRIYADIRADVLWQQVLIPGGAPSAMQDAQTLCDFINAAEKRVDARTANEIKASLPNELPTEELVRIVKQFAIPNFVGPGFCVIAAIHEGRNEVDPSKNNPHAHLLVSTRTVDGDGFCAKKPREINQKRYIYQLRERLAQVVNAAYERAGLDIRVSHLSHKARGLDRIPRNHISNTDWKREKAGERTLAGDINREIERRNLELQRQQDRQIQMYREIMRQR